jgi:putative NADH-flavin reductase
LEPANDGVSYMRITISGTAGGTGKQLVEQALEAGNHVVAYVRNPSKLDMHHEHLTIVQGELTGQVLIERAVRGANAVISVLGPRGGRRVNRSPRYACMLTIWAKARLGQGFPVQMSLISCSSK